MRLGLGILGLRQTRVRARARLRVLMSTHRFASLVPRPFLYVWARMEREGRVW